MRYGWTINDYIRCTKTLEKLIMKEENLEKKNYYMEVYDKARSMIFSNPFKITNVEKRNDNKLIDINDEYYTYNRYFRFLGSNMPRIMELEDECAENFLPQVSSQRRIPHEEALQIIHDFYQNTDKETYKYFLEIYNNRYKTFKFYNDNMSLYNHPISGSISFVDVLRQNFIMAADNKGLTKLVTLAHETGHGISYLYNPKSYYRSVDSFLSEFPSTFFEMAFLNDVGSKIDAYQSAVICNNKLIGAISDYNKFDWQEIFLCDWQDNNGVADKEFFKQLRKKYHQTNKEISNILDVSILFDGEYMIGYLLSLELLYIYKQDKKEALKILRRIISDLDKKDTLDIISKYFKDLEHINEEAKTIQKNLKKEKNDI